jgi:hypothetical protein
MDGTDRILVIVDGSLCSLVGLSLALEHGSPVAWVPPVGTNAGDLPIGTEHLTAVRGQLDRLGVQEIVFPPDETSTPSELGSTALGANTSVSLALLRAAHDAFHLRCRSLLWPVCANADLDELFRVTEIASCVGRLITLDQPGSLKDVSLEVRTPLADMSREQVADLAFDLDAPVECCWSMRSDPERLASEQQGLQSSWNHAIRLAAQMRGWEASLQMPGDERETPARAYV